MSAGRIARHRNYSVLMEQHEKDMKIKRIMRVVIYFLIILFFIIIFLIVNRWEEQNVKDENKNTSELVIKRNSS